MSADGRPGRRSLLIVVGVGVLAIAAGQVVGPLMAKATGKPAQPALMPDAGWSTVPPRPFPPLLRGLELDGGTLLDTTVRDVDWRTGDSIVVRFERLNAPTTTLEVRLYATTSPEPLAHSAKLAVYVVSAPDSGTAQRDEELARALGEFLARAEAEGRPIPQLLPLTTAAP